MSHDVTLDADMAGEPVSPRRRNKRGEGDRLRRDILTAARRLMECDDASPELSLRAIARQAGIAAPSIYAHFPGAGAIAAEVIAAAFADLTAILATARASATDPVGQLNAQCRAYVAFARAHPGLYRVLFARRQLPKRATPQEDSGHGTIALSTTDAIILHAGAPAFDLLVEAIQTCVDAGRSRSTDAWIDAVTLWAALHGYVELRLNAPEFPWPDESAILGAMIEGLAHLG